MEARLTIRVDDTAMRQVSGFVASFAVDHGLDADEQARILILLEELLTNLIKYGYSHRSQTGVAEVVLDSDGARLTIDFIDDGGPFDPLAQPAADLDLSLEDRPLGGFGLHMLRGLTEEMRYSRIGDRNVMRLVRRIAPRA